MTQPVTSNINLTKLNATQLNQELEKAHADPVKSAILKSAVQQANLHKGDASFSFDLSFDLSWGRPIERQANIKA